MIISDGLIKAMLEANPDNSKEAYKQIKAILAHELLHIKQHIKLPYQALKLLAQSTNLKWMKRLGD